MVGKIKTQFGNATIVHSEKNCDVEKVGKLLKEAERKNRALWGSEIKPYVVRLYDTRREYGKKVGNQSAPFVAVMIGGEIVMLTPAKFRRGETLSLSFILYHELNHVIFNRVAGNWRPWWLSEALGLIGQRGYRPSVSGWKKYFRSSREVEKLLYSRTKKGLSMKERNEFYVLSYLCGGYLSKKYGNKKLIGFLRGVPVPYNDKKFWIAFERYFKLSKKEFVAKVIE